MKKRIRTVKIWCQQSPSIGIGYRYRTKLFFENLPMWFLENRGNLVTSQIASIETIYTLKCVLDTLVMVQNGRDQISKY